MPSAQPKATLVPESFVRDIETSREFCDGMLGFEVLLERLEDGFLYLAREGAELMLNTIDQGRTWLADPADPPYRRGVSLMIWAQDAAALYKRMAGASSWNSKTNGIGATTPNSGSRQFIVQDPDGYLLRFVKNIGERSRETPELA